MAYGDPITSALPTPSVTTGPLYATDLRSWADEVEARLETQVGSAGINIDADLDMNLFALTDVDATQYENNAATKTGAGEERKLYVSGGELYYTNQSGVTVRITNAGAIDVGSIKGITGDYSADAEADVNYTSAQDRYQMLHNITNSARAELELGLLRLAGTGNNPTNFATIDAPGLAGSYTLDLFTGLPAANEMVTVNAAGQLAAVTNPTITGLTATGTVSANALSSTTSVTAGTDLKHGNLTKVIPVWDATIFAGATAGLASTYGASRGVYRFGDNNDRVYFPIDLQVGDRIRDISVRLSSTSGDSIFVELHAISASGVDGVVDAGASTTDSSGTFITVSDTGIDHTIVNTNWGYAVAVYKLGGTLGAIDVAGCQVVYDRP